jgi:hypothetical protein
MQKIVSNTNVGVYLQRLGNIDAVLHTFLNEANPKITSYNASFVKIYNPIYKLSVL